MDKETISHYDRDAGTIAERYETADMGMIHESLLRYLPKDGEILELGTGSGREAAYVLQEGYDVTGIDASAGMVRESIRLHPELQNRVVCSPLPLQTGSPLLDRTFDAIVSIATLMHIPEHDLFECVTQIRTMLKPEGILFVSASMGRQEGVGDRDVQGRLFVERPADQIQLLFERLGFRFIAKHDTTDVFHRKMKWFTLIMQKAGGGGTRSIDEIETIIRRDRKDATYKLALLRALCDIAQTEHFRVIWLPDGTISVPLGLVAEKWLEYYWPIIEKDGRGEIAVIPQKRGLEIRKPIAFRKAMRALISFYRSHGGLSAFFHHYRNNEIPTQAVTLLDDALNSIARTIVAGPVTYAGGALERDESFFSFQGRRTAAGQCAEPGQACASLGSILVPSSTWREMCLIGHWVAESLVLRWAELTYEISKRQVAVKDVVELLLRRPEVDRDVQLARAVYSDVPDRMCVWTGTSLSRRFAVDHTMPFSIWRNNDLWNLLPTSSQVNSKKSDKLVSLDVLTSSRDRIVYYWEIMKERAESRFLLEIERSLVRGRCDGRNWQQAAFAGLVENVETLAVHRGLRRWAP
ncbi:methyltransferase domain-containing protein [Candidatus Moduliflexota bacterium]